MIMQQTYLVPRTKELLEQVVRKMVEEEHQMEVEEEQSRMASGAVQEEGQAVTRKELEGDQEGEQVLMEHSTVKQVLVEGLEVVSAQEVDRKAISVLVEALEAKLVLGVDRAYLSLVSLEQEAVLEEH